VFVDARGAHEALVLGDMYQHGLRAVAENDDKPLGLELRNFSSSEPKLRGASGAATNSRERRTPSVDACQRIG
jgi:hypothetical protein